MQYKIDKAMFEALPEETRKEYTLDGEIAILKLEGEDAPTPEFIAKLEHKRNIEAEHRKEAERKVREADDRAAKLQKDLEKAGGDPEKIKKLEEEHAKQIEQLRQEREADRARFKAERDQGMIRDEAAKFTNEHFTIPSLVIDQVAKRLVVEEVSGAPVVRVVNADGSPSTMSVADLHKEFLDNKELSTIIKAKVGSGGGATPPQGSGATGKKLSEMNATEQAKFARENPEAYRAAVEAEG